MLTTTVEDDQDYVRFMAVDSCIAMCSKFSQEVAVEKILPFAKKLATDTAWRVRYMSATKFCEVSLVFAIYIVKKTKLTFFLIYLVIKRIWK